MTYQIQIIHPSEILSRDWKIVDHCHDRSEFVSALSSPTFECFDGMCLRINTVDYITAYSAIYYAGEFIDAGPNGKLCKLWPSENIYQTAFNKHKNFFSRWVACQEPAWIAEMIASAIKPDSQWNQSFNDSRLKRDLMFAMCKISQTVVGNADTREKECQAALDTAFRFLNGDESISRVRLWDPTLKTYSKSASDPAYSVILSVKDALEIFDYPHGAEECVILALRSIGDDYETQRAQRSFVKTIQDNINFHEVAVEACRNSSMIK